MEDFDNLLQEGRLAEAEVLLQKQNPNQAFAQYCWGRLFSRKGDQARAAGCFARALELNPDFEEARVRLEMIGGIYSFRDPNLFNH